VPCLKRANIRTMVRLFVLLASILATAPGLRAQQAADAWPNRPVHAIVPSQAGGAGDIVARIICERLSERLGQQFIVDDRPGAGGVVGIDALARSAPDGYTIGHITASTQTSAPVLMPNLPYDPIKSFAPVALTGSLPYVLAVNPGLPVNNVAELIALAKAKPHGLDNAEFGTSSMASLASLLFEVRAGVEFNQVPYRSTAQAMLDVVEGRVGVQFGTIAPMLPLLGAGKIRALAVTGAERSPSLPEVPSIAEAALPGYEAVLWQAFAAPAGTPAPIIARLNRELTEILAEPATIAALARQGVEAQSSSPEALTERIRSDIEKWRDVVAKVGIKPQ
jgi:tripartite-type tricarboxylate transporter receptor subunit TctC